MSEYLSNHGIAVPEHGFVYVPVPKVASTSIKMGIATSLGMVPKDGNYHDLGFWGERVVSDEVVVASDLVTWTVVRNPFDRLVSRWNEMCRVGRYYFVYDAFPVGTPFRDFALAVCDGRLDDDPHLVPQIRLLTLDGRLLVKRKFRFEFLGENAPRIYSEFGIKLPHANQAPHQHYRVYYSPEVRERVGDYYREDLERFSYGF